MVDCRDAPNAKGAISHEALTAFRYYEEASFLCPNTTEMIIQGDLDSETWKYIEIEVNGCQLPEGQCKDRAEVDNTYLHLYYLTSHADFTDFVSDEVLKPQNREKMSVILDTVYEQKHNMFYTNSTIILDDSPFKMFDLYKRRIPTYEFVSHFKYQQY